MSTLEFRDWTAGSNVERGRRETDRYWCCSRRGTICVRTGGRSRFRRACWSSRRKSLLLHFFSENLYLNSESLAQRITLVLLRDSTNLNPLQLSLDFQLLLLLWSESSSYLNVMTGFSSREPAVITRTVDCAIPLLMTSLGFVRWHRDQRRGLKSISIWF